MASSSSSFVFMQFQRGIFNFFASSNWDILFIYLQFCNPKQVTKIFLTFFLHLVKSTIIITHHAALLVFYIGVFSLFNIYLGMIIFALFVDRINLWHSRCIENLSLYVLSTFSTSCGCTYLLLLLILSPDFQITVTQSLSKSFYIETPTLFSQRHWMTMYRQCCDRIATRDNLIYP